MAITTVNKLIANSYRIIGLNSDDRNLSDSKINNGLDTLNELLDSFVTQPDIIAYFSTVTFNLVTGQKNYEFSNEVTADVTSNKIAQLKYVSLVDLNILYPLLVQTDFIDFDIRRTTDRQARPYQVYLQNENFKSFVIFDVIPDKNYQCNLKAKFFLNNVTLNINLTTLPPEYVRFLKYALGRELGSIYPGAVWNDMLEKKYLEAKKDVIGTSDDDLMQVTSVGLSNTSRNRYYGINPD